MARAIGFMERQTVLSVLFLLVGMTGMAAADFTFGPAANLGPEVNSSADDLDLDISADGLELCFHSVRSGTLGNCDLWVAARPSTDDPWSDAVHLPAPLNSAAFDGTPCTSADGLTLYFCSDDRPGGEGDHDIWKATRSSKSDPWGSPINLGPIINTPACESHPFISADGLSLYLACVLEPTGTYPPRPGGYGGGDIWVSKRTTTDDAWGEPQNLGEIVNSQSYDAGPCLSADGLMLFFHSDRSGGLGHHDIWVTTRRTTDAPWEEPLNLGPPVNTPHADAGPGISADGSTIYFFSGRPGGAGWDLWQVPIVPIVDLNGDAKVDGFEVLAMTDSWATGNPMCDMGPMPWGDGIVDVEDLKVLAEYIGEAVDDPTLIAHWALDKADGNVAYDSAGDNDGDVFGESVWKPVGGMVAGALELDGVTGYILTARVLDPADGPFSVLAWVKGGAPGQVIVSDVDGANWLMVDALAGTLMTELSPPAARTPIPPLVSESLITDEQWHRIGFIWDESTRALYVDDVLVAEDAQATIAGSTEGLYVGCGADQSPDSFFSGLIDDVRLYNRAVRP